LVPVDDAGTVNHNSLWLADYISGMVVGTTPVTFTQLAAPTSYVSGNGITISGTTISADIGNGLDFSSTHIIVKADTTGGTNLAKCINVSANGVAVKIDDATIGNNGSNQLYVKNAGIGPTQLAAQASGTGLQGGNGSNLAILRATRETPSGTVNGSNTAFTTAHTPMSGSEEVYLNGLQQDAGGGADYTISGTTITFNTAPLSGDKVRVSYFY
jgi:hypothetical protein